MLSRMHKYHLLWTAVGLSLSPSAAIVGTPTEFTVHGADAGTLGGVACLAVAAESGGHRRLEAAAACACELQLGESGFVQFVTDTVTASFPVQVLELPTVVPRIGQVSWRGGLVQFDVDPPLVTSLVDVAVKAEGAAGTLVAHAEVGATGSAIAARFGRMGSATTTSLALSVNGGATWHDIGQTLAFVDKDAVKVGFIYVGPVTDGGWSYQHNVGRTYVQASFKGLVETQYTELTEEFCPDDYSIDDNCVMAVMDRYVRDGVQVIIGTSFGYQFAMVPHAIAHPSTKYVHVSGFLTAENMVQAFPRVYMGRYITGIVAGETLVRMGPTDRPFKVGYVGAYCLPETIRHINAFYIGILHGVRDESARLGVPARDVEFFVHWIMAWVGPRKEAVVAEKLLVELGADLISQDTDGKEPQLIAKEHGKLGVGYNSDMVLTVGDTVLSAPVLVWGKLYVEFIRRAIEDQWVPNDNVFVGFEQPELGTMRLSAFSTHVAVGTQERAKAIAEDYASGQLPRMWPFCGQSYSGTVIPEADATDSTGGNNPPRSDWGTHITVSPLGDEPCLDEHELHDMWYLLDGIQNLGPIHLPDSCPLGTFFTVDGCKPCGAGTYGVILQAYVEVNECHACPAGSFSTEPECAASADCIGAEQCAPCPTGTISGSGQAGCSPCPAGTFATGAACEPCAAGSFAAAGAGECTPCPAGSFAGAGQECELCAAGSASPEPGFTKCEVCPPGYEAVAPGTTSCSKCEIGLYADTPGTPTCSVCPDTFTTLDFGSASLSACACPEGRFWSVPDDTCKPCPIDAFCPGGLYLPVVRPAKYGLLKGSAASYAAAVRAKHSLTFDKANFPDAVYDMIVYNCHSEALCPRDPAFESEADTPWDFEFYGVDRKIVDGVLLAVRHGSPETDTGSSCINSRSGIACGRCEEGSYGRVECTECSGAAQGLNVFLLLLLPFLMMMLYRLTSAKDTRRVQTAFVMVSTFGMGAFVIQTVAVFDSFAIHWPIQLSWVFTLGDIFMFDMGGLSLSCLSGQDFQPKYWLSLMVPVLIVFMTGVGFMLSKVLPVPADWVMQRAQTFNMLGMLLTALYVTLVKIVVAYFECTDNPTQGHETLLRYRDVECASEERMGATVGMVLGLVVYVIGFYVKFLHIAYSAPGEWPKLEFREKWRFMLTRWRPDVWFWGSLVMTRNLLVALAGIVSTEPRVQLIYLVWVVTTVFTLTAVWQPWRIPSLNISDVLSCVILNGIGVFGLVFVSLDDEIDLNTRLGRTEVAERQKDLQDVLAIILGILFAAFVGVFLAVIGWALILLVPGRAVVAEAEMEKTLKGLYDEAVETVNEGTIQQDLERLVYNSTDHDRNGLRSILEKLRTSPEQVTQTGYFGKKSKQPAKKQAVTSTQVSA